MNWPNLGRMVGAAVLYAFAAGSVVQAEPPSGKAGVTEAGKRPERTPNMSEAQTIVSARPHEDVRAAEALQKPELDAIANTCVHGVYTDPDGRANTYQVYPPIGAAPGRKYPLYITWIESGTPGPLCMPSSQADDGRRYHVVVRKGSGITHSPNVKLTVK